MFEEYRKQRNNAYYGLYKRVVIIIELYVLVLMIFMCIFFSSAKPLWLLLFLVLLGFCALGVNREVFTKNNQELYYHNGGLFFISYSRFMDEEFKKCNG